MRVGGGCTRQTDGGCPTERARQRETRRRKRALPPHLPVGTRNRDRQPAKALACGTGADICGHRSCCRAVVLSQPNRTRPPASAVPPHPHRIPVLTSPAGTASIPGPGDATAGTAGDEQAGAARGAPNAQPQRDVLARGAAAAKQRECWCRGLSRCGRMLLLRPTPPLPGIGAATGWVSAVASKGSTSPKWRPPPNAQTRTCLASEASRGGAVTDSHPQVRHVGMT